MRYVKHKEFPIKMFYFSLQNYIFFTSHPIYRQTYDLSTSKTPIAMRVHNTRKEAPYRAYLDAETVEINDRGTSGK